ncbi:MAG: DUF72 domain-containing protein [Chloroherpetonaceae bacterium]|nr:DUF72 domain-containing protein [Chthonomonadaceae bacterium]MDW8206460.1 DUF72 domain-containing protein [Chloroherpetonaceae bacterium]
MSVPASSPHGPHDARPIHVGTMGWSYADWLGPFYPPGITSRQFLGHYARVFDCVEIDSTFYGTPPEASVRSWARAVPPGFRFCPKVPRSITHDARLTHVDADLCAFVERMLLLEDRLGPILIQMPPGFTRTDLPALQAFLPLLRPFRAQQVRFAIEFRHPSLLCPEVTALLQEEEIARVAADYAGMPRRFALTAPFAYVRLIGRHGAFEHHRHLQSDQTLRLQQWCRALQDHRARYQEAFVFCNNDYEGYSPATCNRLRSLLGLPVVERVPEAQGTLF